MGVSFVSTEHPTMPVRAETMAVSMAVEDTTVSKVVTTVEAIVSFSCSCIFTHLIETNQQLYQAAVVTVVMEVRFDLTQENMVVSKLTTSYTGWGGGNQYQGQGGQAPA